MRKLAPILIATALAAGLTGCDDDDAPDADFTGDLNEVARKILVETITQSFACDPKAVKIRAGRYRRKDRAASHA